MSTETRGLKGGLDTTHFKVLRKSSESPPRLTHAVLIFAPQRSMCLQVRSSFSSYHRHFVGPRLQQAAGTGSGTHYYSMPL
eukprot:56583-Eustigmatos_ZCMA.PRE.1